MENLQPYKISLDFYRRNVVIINAKQYDSDSRNVEVTCTANDKKVILDNTFISAFIRYRKPDGHYVLEEITINDHGTIEFKLKHQMLSHSGQSTADIMLIDTTNIDVVNLDDIVNGNLDGVSVLSTMSFYIYCEQMPIKTNDIKSSDEYDALITGLAGAVAATKYANEMGDKANTATSNANTATTQANTATINANNATQRANTAAQNAETATSDAETATQACQEIIDKVASIEDFDKIDEILNYKIEVTQEEYDNLSYEEKHNGKIYFITDVYSGGTATEVFYDNSKTGLQSANIQDAIDENANNTSQLSNPNLLINSNFSNPVNQRGFVSNTGTGMYTIDRWYMYSGDGSRCVTLGGNGLILSGDPNVDTVSPIYQRLENLPSNTYTLSAKVNGKIYSATLEWDNNTYVDKQFDDGILLALSYSENIPSFCIGAMLNIVSSIEIEWVKLEQGTIATPFVSRLYAEELMLCQRYYQIVYVYDSQLLCITTDALFFNKAFNVEMRCKPSINLGGIQLRINDVLQSGFTPELSWVEETFCSFCMRKASHGISVMPCLIVNSKIYADAEIY